MRRTLPLAVALLAALPATAAADAEHLDAAIQMYEEGRLRRARRLLRRAEEGDGLTRSDVVRLLVHQALVAYAADDEEDLDAALLRLATLGEGDPLGREAPPPVRAAYEQAQARARRTLAVELDVERAPGRVTVRARVVGDLGALVSDLRVRARAPGGAWIDAEQTEVSVPTPGEVVEVIAEAMGPGGAVVAAEGREGDPEVLDLAAPAPTPPAEPTPPTAPTEDGGGDDAGVIVGVTLLVLAVLGGGAAFLSWYFLVDQAEVQHSVAPPVVVFP